MSGAPDSQVTIGEQHNRRGGAGEGPAKADLQQSGLSRVPGGARPSAKQAEADHSAVVQVGVEACVAPACRQKLDLGRY